MAFSKGYNSSDINKAKNVSDATLVALYLGVYKIPCLIPSPLRKDDKPSFGLYSRNGIKIYWKDFATKERGGIYDLLCKMWGCDYTTALSIVERDILKFNTSQQANKHDSLYVINAISQKTNIRKSDSELKCRIREWRDYDIQYWQSYGVPLSFLKYAEVYPISHKIICFGDKEYVFGADKYAYAFVERKEGKITLKIYQPFNKQGYKWSNKHDKTVVSLWTKIPKEGDKLVICSSLKDALCLWANTGIPALATQGEGYSMSKTAINELKKRYKQIYILFDNDKPGLQDGEKLSKETGFTNLVLPYFEGGKDVSDLYKSNPENFNQLIISLINNINNDKLETSELPF